MRGCLSSGAGLGPRERLKGVDVQQYGQAGAQLDEAITSKLLQDPIGVNDAQAQRVGEDFLGQGKRKAATVA
jgi:hypothetical protein